jgi:hypothetical protein
MAEALQAEPEVAKQQQQETGTSFWLQPIRFQMRNNAVSLLKNSAMPACSKYMAGEREINLEYRRYTGKGLIWVHTQVAMLPDPDIRRCPGFLLYTGY